MNLNNRIGLGTVQFGLKYGINNTSGQVDEPSAEKIIQTYCDAVSTPVFDTASAYGNSEYVLGKIFRRLGTTRDIRVISKFPPQVHAADELHTSLKKSAELLQVNALYAYMAHDVDTVIRQPGLYEELLKLKEKGLIQKAGFSAYHPGQVQWFLDRHLPVDLIQIPYNIFDRRFESLFDSIRNAGIEIHTRSAFLQGLFYKKVNDLPAYFDSVKDKIAYIQQISMEGGISLNKLLLLFSLQQSAIDRVILGVDSPQHMHLNLLSNEDIHIFNTINSAINHYEIGEDILLPYKWPTI